MPVDQTVTCTSNQTYMYHIPSDLSISPPTSVQNIEQTHNHYYYVKSFNDMVETLNNTLQTAYDNLKIDIAAKDWGLPSLYAPYFEFDMTTSKFILNADMNGYDVNDSTSIKVYANVPMFNLMCSFQHRYYGPDAEYGKHYQFMIKTAKNGLNIAKIKTPDIYDAIQIYQDYSTTNLICPIQSIVFTTSLPVIATQTSKPGIINSSGFTANGNNNQIISTLTDYIVNNDNGYGYCSSITYTPSSEYRLFDLHDGERTLKNFDLAVYFKDKYSNLHRVLLYPGCTCNLKLLFRKKEFNNI